MIGMARIILHSRGFQGACEDNIPIETLEKLKIKYTCKFLFFKIIDWEAIYVDWWYSGGGQQTVDKLFLNKYYH